MLIYDFIQSQSIDNFSFLTFVKEKVESLLFILDIFATYSLKLPMYKIHN